MSNIVNGTIQISTVNSIGLHELPPYLKTFIKNFPRLIPELSTEEQPCL